MSVAQVLIATRSSDKLQEIREILANQPGLEIVSLNEINVPQRPEEADLEQFDTFEANALAKAHYFAQRSGMLTLADDSGLCVDALGGAPGVWSKRFSRRQDLAGKVLDAANNALLLDRLGGTPREKRTARYVCVAALVEPAGQEEVFRGTCDGIILFKPRGTGGFGYDALFFVPEENAAFGEISRERKNQISHRAEAFRAAGAALARRVDAAQQKV